MNSSSTSSFGVPTASTFATAPKRTTINDNDSITPVQQHLRPKKTNRKLAMAWFAVSLIVVQSVMAIMHGRGWSDYLLSFQDQEQQQQEARRMTVASDDSDDRIEHKNNVNMYNRTASSSLRAINSRMSYDAPRETKPATITENFSNTRKGDVRESSSSSEWASVTKPKKSKTKKKSPVICSLNREDARPAQCCGTWEVNADEWWTQRPNWEVISENDTHFCFAPMVNRIQAAFVNQVHERQWATNCSNLEKSVEVNSGYGASLEWLNKAFWHAHLNNNPFQIVYTARRWLYSTADNTSWAYCDTEDTQCYYLPVSNCSREETTRGEHASTHRPSHGEEKLHYLWIRQYMLRPKQHYRRKLWAYQHQQPTSLTMQYPCTAMHVRRGDAGIPSPPYRRYAGVYEYIEAADIQKGENIFLMTDDESTIQEVNDHLSSDYNFTYLDRPRNDGLQVGFNGHIPSGDESSDLIAIHTEMSLAQTCDKFVYGQSGFMKNLLDELTLLQPQGNYTTHYVDTSVSKTEAQKSGTRQARVESFLKDIAAGYEERANVDETNPLHVKNEVNPLMCHNTTSRLECCASWDVDADDWWLHMPDWEVSLENETGYCFSPITNTSKAQFMREVHERQWVTGNCSEVEMSAEINSGFGASMGWLRNSFWYAHIQKKPFQIAKSDWHWMYAPKNKTSWAYCDDEDLTCYTLPISPCSREGFHLEDRNFYKPKFQRLWEARDSLWLREYMLRPRQIFRRKAYSLRQTIQMPTPCTVMHARRADSGLPRFPYRRYAAIQEYVDAADIKKGDNVFLMSDDQSSIDEANKYYPDINWKYLERARTGATVRWDGHIPSGDGAAEMLAIDTELKIAATCNKIVHGNSGFVSAFIQKMFVDQRLYQAFYVDTVITKEEAQLFSDNPRERPTFLLKAIEDKMNKLRNQVDYTPDKGSHAKLPAVFSPLQCHTNASSGAPSSCCGSWDTQADEWWTHKPDWEVSLENETSYCFSKMQNNEKAAFFREMHDLQWLSDCSDAMTSWQINSGFGASVGWLSQAFLAARKEKKPFQLTLPHKPWLYGPKDNSSWAYCNERDISCYYLPISPCPREPTNVKKDRPSFRPDGSRQARLEYDWQKAYMLRPKQVMRRKLYEMRAKVTLKHPCTTMHVRRGDAGFPRQPYRRYAAVAEYLDTGKVEEGDNIMLLTDDTTTLAEIQQYHPNYNWVFIDRPRTNGVDGGWQSHIPSNDTAFEILAIETEFRLASSCEKVVHGQSGFVQTLLGKMEMEGRKYERFFVQTGVSKDEAKRWPGDGNARLDMFQNQMKEYRLKNKASTGQSKK